MTLAALSARSPKCSADSCRSPHLTDYVTEALRNLAHLDDARLSTAAKQRLVQRLSEQTTALTQAVRHVDVRNSFLRELKDQGLFGIKHIAGEQNDTDIFTKNVTSAIFNKHVPLYVGTDEYVSAQSSSREAVGD